MNSQSNPAPAQISAISGEAEHTQTPANEWSASLSASFSDESGSTRNDM